MKEFFLESATQAITDYPSSEYLLQQKERVEQAVVQSDTALVLDTAKALLESTLKTIINDRRQTGEADNKEMNQLNRLLKDCLVLNRIPKADDKLKSIVSSVIHNVTELRNEFGAASHGDDAQYENPIQTTEAQFVAKLTGETVCLLLNKHRSASQLSDGRIYYDDYQEFNDYLDTQYSPYILDLGNKSPITMAPSRVLFISDETCYREMLLQYQNSQDEDTEDE